MVRYYLYNFHQLHLQQSFHSWKRSFLVRLPLHFVWKRKSLHLVVRSFKEYQLLLFQSTDSSNSSEIPLPTTDLHSYPSYQPTIASIPSSHSNTISLQTTEIFRENHKRPMIYHASNTEKSYPSVVRQHFSETQHAPEIIFAKSTCQLIKQAWSSSPTD